MNTSNLTTIKTSKAVINGKKVVVDTLHTNTTRQDIVYKVGEKIIGYNAFWSLSPKFVLA